MDERKGTLPRNHDDKKRTASEEWADGEVGSRRNGQYPNRQGAKQGDDLASYFDEVGERRNMSISSDRSQLTTKDKALLERMQAARQDEDARLEDISSMLEGLKMQSQVIGKQLVDQSAHLQHLNEQSARASGRIRHQNKKMDDILR